MIHLEIEKKISEQHKLGILSHQVIDLLVPSGKPHDFEGFQFDYKFFIREDEKKSADDHLDDLIRDFIAFYNSMGGYLLVIFKFNIYGDLQKNLKDNDSLSQKVSSYILKSIGLKSISGSFSMEGEERLFILIYIPKRPINEKPSAFVKNSRNIGDSKKQDFIIKKGTIYCRYEHECKPANEDVELLNYIYSEREPSSNNILSTKIENNLPPRDPNLIQFVGRKEYIELLWKWISEPRRPIKVLTAAGGLGKTTVAYEFATQILDRPGSGFEKIVWLSGKKITFAPLLGRMVSTTRCDFENIDELLSNLLIQVGTPEPVVDETSEIDDKISLCIEAFSTLSILLIIDDVDSLPRDEQNELYATISQIIISSNVHNDNSRVLFTSRLELLTGREQRIAMRGFEGVDFDDYVNVNVEYMIHDDSQKRQILKNKNKIFDASAGSPIFITSIIRLVSLGHELSRAVTDWRGKNGEQIRAFAFEREIDQLSASQREILYAMQLLSRARIDEIREICGLTSVEIETDLSALKDYHLYATKGDQVSGTVIEVPEPIRLMHDVTAGKLHTDRRKVIDSACLRAKSDNDDPARYIALTISQTVRHWKDGNYSVAESYLTTEIRKNEKIGEFYCLRGRTRLNLPIFRPGLIEDDFEKAENYGCNPFDLLKYWYILKLKNKDWRGVYRLHKRKRATSEAFPVFNCCMVLSTIRIADKSSTKAPLEAAEYYLQALKTAFEYIENGKSMGYFHQLRALMNEAAVGYIEILRRSNDAENREISIFRFVASCLDYNLAPTYLVRLGLNSLHIWIEKHSGTASAQRQRSVIVDDLDKILIYLQAQNRVRTTLAEECKRLRSAV